MNKFLDVRCTACGHEEEVFGKLDGQFRCTVCSSDAKRILSPVSFHLNGATGGFPGAAMKWEREHVKAAQRGDKS